MKSQKSADLIYMAAEACNQADDVCSRNTHTQSLISPGSGTELGTLACTRDASGARGIHSSGPLEIRWRVGDGDKGNIIHVRFISVRWFCWAQCHCQCLSVCLSVVPGCHGYSVMFLFKQFHVYVLGGSAKLLMFRKIASKEFLFFHTVKFVVRTVYRWIMISIIGTYALSEFHQWELWTNIFNTVFNTYLENRVLFSILEALV
jgi:hypothetical protein